MNILFNSISIIYSLLRFHSLIDFIITILQTTKVYSFTSVICIYVHF